MNFSNDYLPDVYLLADTLQKTLIFAAFYAYIAILTSRQLYVLLS